MSGFGTLVVVAPPRGRDNYGSMEGGTGPRSGKHQNGLCAVEGKRQRAKSGSTGVLIVQASACVWAAAESSLDMQASEG